MTASSKEAIGALLYARDEDIEEERGALRLLFARQHLGQHQGQEDEPAAQKLPGRHALVEEQGAEQGPEHALEAHDEGSEGRGQVPLAHDLERS